MKSEDNINISFICDDAYSMATGVAISSLRKNRDLNRKYVIFILCNSVSNANKAILKELKDTRFEICLIDISKQVNLDRFGTMPFAKHVSPTALVKFDLPTILKDLEKVLYLDGDILIRDSLVDLYDMELGGHYAATCRDIGADKYPKNYKTRLKINHSFYFNSGVMLLNLNLLRKEQIPQQLLEYKINGINDFMDQDAFNVVFHENVIEFSVEYNTAVSCWRGYSCNALNQAYNTNLSRVEDYYLHAKIMHFSAPEKPWLYCNVIGSEEWIVDFQQSPFCQVQNLRKWHPRGLSLIKNECNYNHIVDALKRQKSETLISVIIPVYNAENYLHYCIESLLTQTFSNAEFIFVDDGSTDCSVEILQHYERTDARIHVLQQKNQYAGVARNTGLAHTRGKYITFLDSDDLMVPTALELFYKCALETDADIVVSSAWFFSNDIKKVQLAGWCLRKEYLPSKPVFSAKSHTKYLFQISAGAPWGKLYKASFIKKHGICFPPLPRAEDFVFVYWAFAVADRIAILDKKTIYYRIVGGSGSLEDKKDAYPTASLEGRKLLWNKLCEIGMLPQLRQSFLNNTTDGIAHNLQTFKTGIAFEQMYNMFKDEIIPLIGLSFDDPTYFYNKSEFNYVREVFSKESCAVYWYDKCKEAQGSVPILPVSPVSKDNHQNVVALQQKIRQLQRNVYAYQQEIDNIHASWTYRIGRFITFVPRELRGGIRCLKEHGVGYTFNRLLVHLHLKADPYTPAQRPIATVITSAPTPTSPNIAPSAKPATPVPVKKDYDFYYNLFPDQYEEELKFWYKSVTGDNLDLENPKTFNEKIQWLKLYDSTPLKTRLADKYLVRDWVAEQIGEEYLVPLLGVWDNFDEIDFDQLPNQFALKTNHGSGWNLIVKDKSQLNLAEAKEKFDKWMKKSFAFVYGMELHYMNIPPKIIAEKYIESIDQVYDYKFMCFNGEVKFIWVDTDRFTNHKRTLFTCEWERMPERLLWPCADYDIPKPENFDKMMQYSKILSKGFVCARVDFYEVDGKLYFGEVTFTSSSGTERAIPREFERTMGDMITLPPKSPIPERMF